MSVKIPAVFRFLVMEMLASNAKISFTLEAIGSLTPPQLSALTIVDEDNSGDNNNDDDSNAESDAEDDNDQY